MESTSGSPRYFFWAFRAEPQEVGIVDTGDFDRILEREENAFGGALFRFQLQQILALVDHAAFDDFVALAAGQYCRAWICRRGSGP